MTLAGMPAVGVDTRGDLRFDLDNVTNVEGRGAAEHAESVRRGRLRSIEGRSLSRWPKKIWPEGVALPSRMERRYLPSGIDTEIRRGLRFLVPSGREPRLALVIDDATARPAV